MIETIYRLLLTVYPADFRRRFGAEMIDTARALDRRGVGVRGRIDALVDAARTAVALRAEYREERRLLAGPHGAGRLSHFERDVRFAWRGLRRDPRFVAFVMGTLALAIGANAALFGIADRLLLRGPDHVRDEPRVGRVYLTSQPAGMRPFTTDGFGHVTYDVIRRGARSAAGVAVYAINAGTIGRGTGARPVQVGYASAGFFPLLGVTPASGRFPTDAEDSTSGPSPVAVLSQASRRSLFGADDDPIGRAVVVNDEAFTVIGVAPPGFTGAELGPVDVWLPMTTLSRRITPGWTSAWNAQWLKIIVRMTPGVTADQAAVDLTALFRGAYAGDEPEMRVADLRVAPLSAGSSGDEPTEARVVRWLSGVGLIVFLVACASVMNLLLARGARRVRDVGIALALGATRAAIVRTLLVESTLLSAGGAGVGLLFAQVLGGLTRRTLLPSIEWTSPPVNLRVVLVTTAAALVAAVAAGLVPALGVSRTRPSGALRSGTREGGGHRRRLRTMLVGLQAALSVALLIGAGLFLRSFANARALDLGIDADRVLVVEVARQSLAKTPAGPERDAERTRRSGFLLDAVARVRALPSVERASIAVGLPFGNRFSQRTRVPGLDALPRLESGGPGVSAVEADYFQTMGTTILRGRAFTPADRAGSAPVAIINELMARTVWPGREAIGQCVMLGEDPAPCATVVGIAGNTYRSRLRESPSMHIYLPLGQERDFGGAVLIVRGGDDPTRHAEAVRRELLSLDGSITFVSADTIQARIDPQMRSWRLGASVFAWSGLVALVVSAVGIYAVLSYFVADRRRELGVRIALGARTSHVRSLLFRWSVGTTAAGIAAGALLSAASAPLLQPLLFNVSARDPLVFGLVGAVLLLVAACATLVPALRASRVDPLEALKAE